MCAYNTYVLFHSYMLFKIQLIHTIFIDWFVKCLKRMHIILYHQYISSLTSLAYSSACFDSELKYFLSIEQWTLLDVYWENVFKISTDISSLWQYKKTF